MKKKLILFFITLFVLLIGGNVYAFELTCPLVPFNYGDYFDCYVLGGLDSYETLSGTLDKDNYLDCHFDTTKVDGLDIVDDPSKTFSLKGNAYSTTLVTFNCLVRKKLDSNITTSLTIDNFKYVTAKGDRDEIILHSKDISINKYVDESQNKVRDTSYDGSLIKSLTIDNVKIPNKFSKYVTVYNIKVPYEIDSLNFNISLVDDNAVYEIEGDPKNLRVGETTIIDIKVTSADNNHQTYYTFEVTRYAEGEEIYYPEEDATLQSLTIDGYTLDFDPMVEEYNLHIKSDVSAIKVTAKPTVDGATFKMTDTNSLEDGTIVAITVKSKNLNNEKIYKINIHKEKKKPMENATYIVIATVIVLGLGLFFFLRTSRTKFEAADGSGDLKKKKTPKKVDETPYAQVPEVGGADINGLQAVKKDEATQVNVVSINESNVAQVMQDTQVHNVQLNNVTSANRNIVMTQKTAAMPKIVTGTGNAISENDYQGDIFEERDAAGNFIRYTDAAGNTVEYVDEYGNPIKPE